MVNKKTRRKNTVRRRHRKRQLTVRRKYFGAGITYQCVNTWTALGYSIAIRHRDVDVFRKQKQNYALEIYGETLTQEIINKSPIFVDIMMKIDKDVYYNIIQLTGYSLNLTSTPHTYKGKIMYISFKNKDNQFMEVIPIQQKVTTMTSRGLLKCFTMNSNGEPYGDNEVLNQMNQQQRQQQGSNVISKIFTEIVAGDGYTDKLATEEYPKLATGIQLMDNITVDTCN